MKIFIFLFAISKRIPIFATFKTYKRYEAANP